MSVFEEFLKKHCPDGVEYVPLWSVTIWDKKFNSVDKDKQKTTIKYKYYLADELKQLVVENGDVKILTTNISNLFTLEKLVSNSLNNGEIVCIPWGGNPIVQYYKGKFITSDNRIATSIDVNKLDNKFLYYVLINKLDLISSFYRGAGIKHPDMSKVLDIIIPIPPIEVQKEIVRILDTFTKYQDLLNRELELRKKQYEYYRDKLLTFGDDVPLKKLGDIAIDIYRGTGIKKDEVTEKGIPCVRYGEIYTKYNIWFDKCFSHTIEENIKNRKYFEYGDVLFAITGESVKEISKSCVYIGHDKCLAGGDIVVLKHNQNPKYMGYVLSTTNAQIQKSKGKVKSKVVHSNVQDISDILIPVPPLEEQKRIVNILDKFDALCNDITRGLPAEIELRKKQYEYYRDKLLTFKEKKK